jgi:hypothetical protein
VYVQFIFELLTNARIDFRSGIVIIEVRELVGISEEEVEALGSGVALLRVVHADPAQFGIIQVECQHCSRGTCGIAHNFKAPDKLIHSGIGKPGSRVNIHQCTAKVVVQAYAQELPLDTIEQAVNTLRAGIEIV